MTTCPNGMLSFLDHFNVRSLGDKMEQIAAQPFSAALQFGCRTFEHVSINLSMPTSLP